MLLSLDHVAKTHWVGPYEKRTLVDVSLSVAPGDFVGVWGARRSGKSTLLRIAAGLDQPDSGRVHFDGRVLATLSGSRRGDLRLHAIGLMLGAGPHSPEFTVCDYVALPLLGAHTRARARGIAIGVLRSVGIVDCHDVRWNDLTDSERTLANLAHCLARRPRLLLVDDPTAGLDALQQAEVMRLLRTTAHDEKVAVLMTVSTMSALAGVDEAFTLSDGLLVRVTDDRSGTIIDFPVSRQFG